INAGTKIIFQTKISLTPTEVTVLVISRHTVMEINMEKEVAKYERVTYFICTADRKSLNLSSE
ncbi:MAG: hypothetical protein MUE38_01815, partial [Flavihumibacter sp.]|nr:hypothetical protein [Flavihumibacter sp.]